MKVIQVNGHASGWKASGVSFPRVLGSDIAGTIVRVGKSDHEHIIGKVIVPIIDKTFNLVQTKEAQAYFKIPGKRGKVVLLVD
jgi:NADPH:quinone reductase-like Zn-dependent oxidoreductase